ncbi:dihydrolipoyl dehydrogenase [Amphiplicatus metriothermophilus]|uniref:Dihydrolipoyl dehydrogenase n=1 Tax=Amphiplicatus metriothermophilus TaxID=1519374 RepID=A0A239PR37_9PROT|nr:dihydrolipoyl dehydrogenase [Amphiplicatus metriothermophilus]MBB5518483.1 dihydrolipoamide dehydrogenase [Amphiplicatus metriothermophilus]SNT72356.1 dihydrolipoamide dehydrogenase [Amphiplicatus metriothermophilus]
MAEIACDVCVIGAGPGGYVAAIRASQLGLKTVIVEREHLGGVCLNWGCIPTKALLRTAEIYGYFQHAKAFGLKAENVGFDLEAVVERSRKVAGQLSKGVGGLMKKNKIQVIDGAARLAKSTNGAGAPLVKVKTKNGGEETVRARHVILATGARARTLPKAGLEPDGKFVWTAKEAMVPDAMPKRLLVVGSGAIGIEFASFYRSLGAEVTVVEMLDRILPAEDEEISKFAEKQFKKQGMTILTGATVEKLEKNKQSAIAAVKKKDGKTEKVEADRVIVAIGITGNTDGLGLEELGVKVEKGHVVVNEWLETGVKGLYAIGDLVGPPWLAHKASHEGVICVEKIAGLNTVHPLDVSKVPGCTYSNPQVASVGLTEAEAKEKGYKVRVGRFPFVGNGKAIALGEPEGLVKTVFDDKTGELLGAHMIGAEVTELIQGFGVARTLEATEEDLFHAVFPHPTLSEMMHESALDAFGRVVHI